MGRPLRLDEVRVSETVDDISVLDGYDRVSDEEWSFGALEDGRSRAERTDITPCVRCGRWAEDPTRSFGAPVAESYLKFHLPEDEQEPVCSSCREKEKRERQETEVLELLESKLGLEEKHRDALRSFIETMYTDPDKIVRVERLNGRVEDLETQNGRLWTALGIVAGLVAISIAGVVGIALALAS